MHIRTDIARRPSPSCSRTAPRRRQAMLAPSARRRSNSLSCSGPPSTMLPQLKVDPAPAGAAGSR